MTVERSGEADRARLRCPFCHDALGADEVRVTCVECAAPQHASCFVENEACAATGCGGRRVRAGERELSLDELVEADAALGAYRRPSPAGGWMLLAAALAVAAGSAALLGEGLVGIALMALGVVLVVAAIAGSFFTPRRRNVRDPKRERELWASIGLIAPDRLELGPELLEHQVAPLPPGARPATCPACRGSLVDEDEPDDDTPFCHHCGASLAPEEPGKGT